MKRVPSIVFLSPSRPRWAGWVLAAAAAACLGASAYAAWRLELTVREHGARLALAQAAQSPRSTPSAADRALLLQARSISNQLNAPWDQLLGVFEEHSMQTVGLLKLEPDAKAAIVRVTAQAGSAEDMVSYVAALESDNRLADVVLASHQIERDTAGRPLRFMLVASWKTTGATGLAAPAAPLTRIAKVSP
jgi:hypothetical protein